MSSGLLLDINIPDPELQVSFASALSEIRTRYLQDALSEAVNVLPIPEIDKELALYVPARSLSMLASHGLRGEMMFPVPLILTSKPRLLAYYRLLYGFSQKEFYGSSTGLSRFKGMEERGAIRKGLASLLPIVCDSMARSGAMLLAAIGSDKVSVSLLSDLTLLTLGPQLRGGANVRKGSAGIRIVFNAIRSIVDNAVTLLEDNRIEMRNAAGRIVQIEFAPDPDIIIREEMRPGHYRQLIAIEVKAGSDFSNIHNRIGEAEKSHQKARGAGYVECWTVVNVDKIDVSLAHKESPSTNRFYRISDILTASGKEYEDFRDRVISLTGTASYTSDASE